MKHRIDLQMALCAVLLAGCGSITGLVDAGDEFGCPIESGVNCSRLSKTFGVTEEALRAVDSKLLQEESAKALPELTLEVDTGEFDPDGWEREVISSETETVNVVESVDPEKNGKPEANAMPPTRVRQFLYPMQETLGRRALTRAPEEVLALWVLPWVDTEGDLHATERLWVRVQDARWKLELLKQKALDGKSGFGGLEP